MLFRKLLFVPLVLFVVAFDAESGQKGTSLIISGVLSAIESNEYQRLSEQFHYPPNYTDHELEKDKCNMKYNVEDMVEHFGKPMEASVLKVKKAYYDIGVTSGDTPYWSKYPVVLTLLLDAQFAKVGNGVIKIDLVEMKGRYKLKTIGFGYYASELSSLLKVKEFGKHLYEKRQERDSTNLCQK